MSEYILDITHSEDIVNDYRKLRNRLKVEFLGEMSYPLNYPYDMPQNPTAMEQYGPLGLTVPFGIYEVRIPSYNLDIPNLPGARLEITPSGMKYLLLYEAVPRILDANCSPTDYTSYIYQENKRYKDIADPGALALAQCDLPVSHIAKQLVEDSLRNVRKALKCPNDWMCENPDSYYLAPYFIQFACTNHLSMVVKTMLQENYNHLYKLFPGTIPFAYDQEVLGDEMTAQKQTPAVSEKNAVKVHNPFEPLPVASQKSSPLENTFSITEFTKSISDQPFMTLPVVSEKSSVENDWCRKDPAVQKSINDWGNELARRQQAIDTLLGRDVEDHGIDINKF